MLAMDEIDQAIVRLLGYRAVLDWCLLLKVRAASPLALQDLIDRVRAVAGVQATMTTLALSSLHGPSEATT
jgi:DNA-binding Lrp family transcriptional regulator